MPELSATIRPARPSDAAAIARVHVETWQATYPGLVPDRYLVGLTESRQSASWRHWIAAPRRAGTVLIAEAPARGEPALVGFGSCGRARKSSLPYGGEIFTLYVTTDWQGLGLGRRLLAALFQSLTRLGHSDAGLWVLTGNPSRFFYEAMGGMAVAERKESFAGTLLDETAYGWPDLHGWLAALRA